MKKVQIRLNAVKRSANLTRIICDQVIGEKHSINHRLVCGCGFVLIGVLIAGAGSGYFHVFCEGFGYIVHGIGTVPMVEKLGMLINSANQTKDEK